MTSKTLVTLVPAMIAGLMLSGCLKTRAQLRGEDETAVPNRTEPVADRAGYAVDEIKSEITRLTGRIEDLERANKGNDPKKADDQLHALENRIKDLEQAQIAAIEALKKIQSEMPAPDNVIHVQKGKEALRSRRYEEAVAEFSIYLKNPNGKLAEDAYFNRGEAYYSLKNYKKAIVDYSKFPEKFQKSSLMPKALLRIGQSFELLGAKDDAHAFYEQVVDEFPKTAEAKEARKKVASKKKVK